MQGTEGSAAVAQERSSEVPFLEPGRSRVQPFPVPILDADLVVEPRPLDKPGLFLTKTPTPTRMRQFTS